MICESPYVKGNGEAYPCGGCLACLIRRRKIWQHRIQLENLCHSDSAFVTLTYAQENMPTDMSLRPVDASLFLKRLREKVSPKKLRYYLVGEYGEKSERPHYHLCLFGYPTCLSGRSRYSLGYRDCCSQCDRVRDTWALGHVDLGTITKDSAGYVCGYMTKNMRRFDDVRLNGRHPEFARMSLKPGLGVDALWEPASVVMMYDLLEEDQDVPLGLRHGSSIKPFGRYLRRKFREMLGRDASALVSTDAEMLALWESAKAATPKGGEARKVMFKNLLQDASEQKVANMKARSLIFDPKRKI